LGSAELIEALIRVKDSFNSYPVDRFASAGAIAAMQDSVYFQDTCRKVVATREALMAELANLDFEVLPSGANFIFAKHRVLGGAEITAMLRQKNIIVRHFKAPRRIAPYLRITIGTDAQTVLLLKALREIVS
jgi:histidinol-phosphate aminotransferase